MKEMSVPGEGFVERRSRNRSGEPVLTVLYHPDLDRVGDCLRLDLECGRSGSDQVVLSRDRPRFTSPALDARPGGAPLADPALGPLSLTLRSHADGGMTLAPAPGTTGDLPVEVEGHPLEGPLHLSPAELDQDAVLLLANRVVLLLHCKVPRSGALVPRYGLVGESDAIDHVRRRVQQVADLDVPVLLQGETGTGKELVARAVHQSGRRREKPFLSLNLGAVPPTLAAAELFGSVKGAFTGADRTRAGYFQRADGGTLFLDEVGEAPTEVQVMLLRTLENGEIQPVGSLEPRRVDVRVVAATDADLEAAIDAGEFRAPLLHRLAGYTIVVPPLRERRDDVGRLLAHFLRQEAEALGEGHRLLPPRPGEDPWLPASIVARLARYSWPGNVRELWNLARQMVIESRGASQVRVGPQVEQALRRVTEAPAPASSPTPGPRPAIPDRTGYRSPAQIDEEELLSALRANRWRLQPTAAHLGISRPSLYTLVESCPAVRKASELSSAEIREARREADGDLEAMVERLEVSGHGLKMRMKELGIRLAG
jgi:two-component system, NtrC family, nitrogen regulation response regulator GlnG